MCLSPQDSTKIETNLNLVILSVSTNHLASIPPCVCAEYRESQEVLKLRSATYLQNRDGTNYCISFQEKYYKILIRKYIMYQTDN